MFKYLTLFLVLLVEVVYSQNSCTPPTVQMSLRDRADSSKVMAYVKIIRLENEVQQSYGRTYSAYVEVICALKNEGGSILLNEFFTITDLGERPLGCPSRVVQVGEEIIFFLNRTTPSLYTVDEINQQTAVIPASWDNLQLLNEYVKGCLTGLCRPNDDIDWQPMSEEQRAEIAEIIVWAKIVETHQYGSQQGYYIAEAEPICEMKIPENMKNGLGKTFNVTNVGALQGLCEDRHVSKGHEFIMFLTRHFAYFPVPGQTIPPYQLENYVLGLDEVNSQHAIFNITENTVQGFDDYLAACPTGGGNSSSKVAIQLSVFLVSFLFVALTLFS